MQHTLRKGKIIENRTSRVSFRALVSIFDSREHFCHVLYVYVVILSESMIYTL